MRTVGAVDIVDLGDGDGRVDGGDQLVGQLALRLNEILDLLTALFDIAQIIQPLLKRTQYGVIKTPRDLFAVTRDEGDGVALVNESDRLFDLIDRKVQFFGECFDNVHE